LNIFTTYISISQSRFSLIEHSKIAEKEIKQRIEAQKLTIAKQKPQVNQMHAFTVNNLFCFDNHIWQVEILSFFKQSNHHLTVSILKNYASRILSLYISSDLTF
jgi:hypothetical protein